MRLIHPGRLATRFAVLPCLWLTLCLTAFAQDDTDGLLPVTEAYKLSADASTPGVLRLHWTIAPDYYLYRGRMKFKPGDGVTLGDAQLPDGEKHHDQYLGDVETYHHSIDATVPYTLAAGTSRLKLSVQYQGCHEVDPKICYPPHTEQLDLELPANTTAAATGHSRWASWVQAARAGWTTPRCRRNKPSASKPWPLTASTCYCAGPCPRATTSIATRPRCI
jgi:thiol:disulfide interchange protein